MSANDQHPPVVTLAPDRTRIGYVRRAYGVDGEDPGLYHLMIDSTAVDLDTCADLIVTASQARARRPAPMPAPGG